MTIQEGNHLRSGAGVIRGKMCGIYTGGDVVLDRP